MLSALDCFRSVSENPRLYGSERDCQQEEAVIEATYRDASPSASAGARLGVLYAIRLHSPEKDKHILQEVRCIAHSLHEHDDIVLIARFVEAAVYNGMREFTSAVSILDDLTQRLTGAEWSYVRALAIRNWGIACLYRGYHANADHAFQDALVSLRRCGSTYAYAVTLSEYAMVKKRLGHYREARQLSLDALHRVVALGARRSAMFIMANLAVIAVRMGEWRVAAAHYDRLAGLFCGMIDDECSSILRDICIGNNDRLLMFQRRFDAAEKQMVRSLTLAASRRGRAMFLVSLGELCLAIEDSENASKYLEEASELAAEIAALDVTAEVLRVQGELYLSLGEVLRAKAAAIDAVRLGNRTADLCERGIATRVLGEVYARQGDPKRATVCFAKAVADLRSIHECYELMRALYAQGVFLAQQTKRDESEISLLEARQLAKKLELDYYQALIAIALVDVLTPQERWSEASTWLAEATTLRDSLEGIDRERVEKALQRSANELQQGITRASVREAETLKTICRVYEDARFPIAEMKPDLAYQVAQSVGGECLFVVGRKGSGFNVPLTYNIAVNEAKDIVRQLDASPKKPLFGLDGGPQVLTMQSARTLVAVPCYVTLNGTGKDKSAELYAFCTRFDGNVTVTPRQMELLYASSDALARLIEDEGERHAQATPEEQSRARHPRGSFKDILTIDADMIKLIKVAERAATSVAPILLEGETGVGKELFARAIHGASKRKEGPFVAVNAGGMSVSLLESELFGHVRGAFTDASSDRLGFIESARSGTLFLDEVGEMGEELQVKLLRLLENGEYRRLGESSVRKADVRIISATNRELKKEVDRGNFRRDLYYRVAPLRLTIPPLRMRTCDIQLMVRHFLRDCAQMNGIADRYIEIDVKAMEALELYDWPGNVRELFNEILRVVSLIGRGDLVRFTMLSEGIQDYLQAKKRGTDGLLERSVEQYERRLILHALEKNDWNHLRTAEAIGVPRTTLLAKLKRLNIASK